MKTKKEGIPCGNMWEFDKVMRPETKTEKEMAECGHMVRVGAVGCEVCLGEV